MILQNFMRSSISKIYAEKVPAELDKLISQQNYIPQTMPSDLGAKVTRKLMTEDTNLMVLKLKHNSLKHPQTIGAVERSHGRLKRFLELKTEEYRKDRRK